MPPRGASSSGNVRRAMKLQVPLESLYTYLGFAGVFVALVLILERVLRGRSLAIFHYVAAGAGFLGLAYVVGKLAPEHARAVDFMKAVVALTAASGVFYEMHRAGQKRPVAERWKKIVGVTLALAAITLYFNGFKFGYPKYYHRWDQYHYYMGAKYFPELGYDGLYKCSAIAQDELGTADVVDEFGKKRSYNFRAEVRKSDKTIRNLSGDNLLMKVDELLANPEQCTSRFSPERWEAYKHDVAFFSSQCNLDKYWSDMQRDHGYNPPPVWTLAGYLLGNLAPASVNFMQFLAAIDLFYLAGVFVVLWWAFGWRVFAVGAIFWGCQSSAPFYWTGGAMLRQDWLFFLVLAAGLTRKRYFKLAGAAMVYAGLLRIFPGLAVVGWLTVTGWYVYRHKKLRPEHLQTILGGTLAAALLIGASLAVVGTDSYQKFYHHTLRVHDQTPLTNHMGLRVLVGHNVGSGKESGRMKYTKDVALVDPFEVWKRMRVERYKAYKPVAYAVLASSLVAFVVALRRVRSLWIAQCLGQVWIILLSQLTCYYYSFMILSAPLTRVRKDLEVWIFGFAALSQFVWMFFYWNDDRYTALTLISLLLCYFFLFSFAPRDALPGVVATKRSPVSFWGGLRLGGLIASASGVALAAMGQVHGDRWSRIMGVVTAAAGAALFAAQLWANKPKPVDTASSGPTAA